jgi:hypothetical protein
MRGAAKLYHEGSIGERKSASGAARAGDGRHRPFRSGTAIRKRNPAGAQFRDVVAQGRKIGGEIFRFTARHICSPVLRGMTVHGYAWDNAVCV